MIPNGMVYINTFRAYIHSTRMVDWNFPVWRCFPWNRSSSAKYLRCSSFVLFIMYIFEERKLAFT